MKKIKINLNNYIEDIDNTKINELILDYINDKITFWAFSRKLIDLGLVLDEDTLKPIHKELDRIRTSLVNIFKKFDIKLFPFAGTMLGFNRDNGYISHDDDADFAVSFKLIQDNADQISKYLAKKNIIIHKHFYEDTTYYVYHLKSEIEINVLLGNREYSAPIMVDLFPTVSFSNESYFFDYFHGLFKALLTTSRPQWRKIYTIWVDDQISKFSKLDNFAMFDKYVSMSRFTAEFEKIKSYRNEELFFESSNDRTDFMRIFDLINDGSQENIMIAFPCAFFQIPINKTTTAKIKSKFGTIKFLKTEEDSLRLRIMYGENWNKRPKYFPLHILLKNHLN